MATADAIARHRVLRRYLLDGERVVTAVHQHWAKVAEPVATALASLVLALWLDAVIPASTGHLADVIWWLWLMVVVRAVWLLLGVAARLVRGHRQAADPHLRPLTQKVAMMPLSKVTDMSYNRSPLGRVLGFGTVRHGERRPGAGAAPRQLGARPRPHLPRDLRRDLRRRGPRPGPDQPGTAGTAPATAATRRRRHRSTRTSPRGRPVRRTCPSRPATPAAGPPASACARPSPVRTLPAAARSTRAPTCAAAAAATPTPGRSRSSGRRPTY